MSFRGREEEGVVVRGRGFLDSGGDGAGFDGGLLGSGLDVRVGGNSTLLGSEGGFGRVVKRAVGSFEVLGLIFESVGECSEGDYIRGGDDKRVS